MQYRMLEYLRISSNFCKNRIYLLPTSRNHKKSLDLATVNDADMTNVPRGLQVDHKVKMN